MQGFYVGNASLMLITPLAIDADGNVTEWEVSGTRCDVTGSHWKAVIKQIDTSPSCVSWGESVGTYDGIGTISWDVGDAFNRLNISPQQWWHIEQAFKRPYVPVTVVVAYGIFALGRRVYDTMVDIAKRVVVA